MNRDRVLMLLRHARLMLDGVIEGIESDSEGDGFPQLMTLLPHVYCNLNQAWNERDLPCEADGPSGSDRFPTDLPGISDL